MKRKLNVIAISGIIILISTLYYFRKPLTANVSTTPSSIQVKPETPHPLTTNASTPLNSWVNYNIADAFTIEIPPTVELRHNYDPYTKDVKNRSWYGHKIDTTAIVFQQRGLSKWENLNTYCRVILILGNGSKGDFAKATDGAELSVEEIRYYQDLIKESVAHLQIISSIEVRYIRIGDIYGIEVEYFREGLISKSTHVFTYFLFNYDEYVNITISYSQKDASLWEADLSEIIGTFKWTTIK